MRLAPKTLYAKIALVFWLLIVLVVSCQYLVFSHYWKTSVSELLQRLHWDLAESFAEEFRPLTEKNPDPDLIQKKITKLAALNPGVDIFIIGEEGELLYYLRKYAPNSRFKEKNIKVDLRPVRTFLSPTPTHDLPILGTNPLHNTVPTVFSVAPLTINSKPGYVYVTLVSSRLWSLIEGTEDYYFLTGGIFILILLVGFMLAVGAMTFSLVTKRFRILAAGIHSFAAGNLEERIPVKGDDEIGQLSSEINQMADTIVSSLDSIKEKDASRRQLTAMVAHDLGGLVATIHAFLESMQTEFESSDFSREKLREYLEIAITNSKLLSRLIRDLHQLSMLEARKNEPERHAISIIEIVSEEIIPRLNKIAEEKDISIKSKYPEDLPYAHADVDMIERVLSNLISNGIRYGKNGGEVCIELSSVNDKVQISIIDNGEGISKENLPHIFEAFYRGTEQGKHKKGSTGLGLAIVKMILEAHGEEISVASEKDVGTTFSFQLPVYKH